MYPQRSVPNTDHSVWYAYSMHVNNKAIGSLERISSRSSRNVERIREILFSRGPETVEQVWSGTDTTIELSYVELYDQSVFEALGTSGIYSLEDWVSVFNITEIMRTPGDAIRIIDYVDCVPSDWSRDLDSSGSKVIESITVSVRKIQARGLTGSSASATL